MAERQLLISHPIGAGGRFRLTTASGTVRIDGTDGEVAEVLARYRAPGGLEPTADPALDGIVDVVRSDGELQIAVRDPGGTGVLASLTRLVGQYRPDVDFEVRLPRGVTVRVDGSTSDMEVRGLRGDQDLRTVSGDLRIHGAGGRLRVTTVSGDVAATGDVLWFCGSTTSGDIAVQAELMQQLTARSVSGDVSIRAALGRESGHTFESVSGDLQLMTPSGLAIEVTGVSGSVRSDMPTRREQRDGRRTTIVGDGSVSLRVRTVSGDVVVSAPGPRAARRYGHDPLGEGFGAAFGAGFGDAGPAPMPPWPAAPPGPPAVPPVPPGGAPPVMGSPPSTGAANASTPATDAGSQTDQLAILRLLESGQIDVDEAARRLEARS